MKREQKKKTQSMELQNQDLHGTAQWIAPQTCPTQLYKPLHQTETLGKDAGKHN